MKMTCGLLVATVLIPANLVAATADLSAGGTVARIGDRNLSLGEFQLRAGQLLQSGYQHLDTLGMEAKRQLLDGVLAQELLVLEGLQRQVGDDPVIAMDLARTERRALMNALYDTQALIGDYSSTEQELRAYFVEAQYDMEVLSRHIVCGSQEQGVAVHAALLAGTSFEELVAKHSRRSIQDRFGPSGWVGWFRIGELYEQLQKPLLTMAPGEFYPEPVQTSLGYHVFGLQARRPTSFDASREFLRDKLRIQKRANDMESYINGLRKRYDVRPDDQGLRLLTAVDVQDSSSTGRSQTLITWAGGQLSIADFMDLVRDGRTQHPASLNDAALRKEVDNQAGMHVMMTEARKLGLHRQPQVAQKTDDRRRELFTKWLFVAEGKQRAQPDTSAANIRQFYDRNLDLFTRTDGTVTDFEQIARSIRTLLIEQAETVAMDRFIAALREKFSGQIEIDMAVLEAATIHRPQQPTD